IDAQSTTVRIAPFHVGPQSSLGRRIYSNILRGLMGIPRRALAMPSERLDPAGWSPKPKGCKEPS
ncbi:MAG: hypothetical protein ACPIOQ_18555, partial [Promethearchaeia archaeon]